MGFSYLKESKTELDQDRLETVTSKVSLTSLHCNHGVSEEAKKLRMQMMEIHRTWLGETHADTLKGLAHPAFTYTLSRHDAKSIELA
ncbi:hypothetical protein N7523_000254 [Penicillium sp. IBT 18751x]|nr:hypothetical protein N7523_000254 [Penicillium sp. IBT 18751x]